MIRKHPQIKYVEETENVKWCVFKVPQYIKDLKQLSNFNLSLDYLKVLNRTYNVKRMLTSAN